MQTFAHFIVNTQEYLAWGWNATTFSFVATIFLTFFLQARGLIGQIRVIWQNRSGEGVDVLTFVVSAAYFGVFFFYAISLGSAAGVVNALVLSPLYLPILVGLWRFKGFSRVERGITVLAAMLVIVAALTPRAGDAFLVVSAAVIAALALQPLAMWRAKSSENVSIKFVLGFLITTLFWLVYAVAIRDVRLGGVTAVLAVLYGSMLFLWHRYRRPASSQAA